MSNGGARMLCGKTANVRPTGQGQNCIFRLIMEAVTGHRYIDLNYYL